MIQIFTFILFTGLGYLIGWQMGINPIEEPYFAMLSSIALVIGLYGSVVGIDLGAVSGRKWTAVIVITLAVPLQIVATGAVMYLIYPMAVSWLVAVAITQIDPLSVDTLLQDKDNMSDEAKGLLRIWASFDDPVTVLFGFLILLPLATGYTLESESNLFLYLTYNLLPAGILWFLQARTKVLENKALAIGLLLLLLGFAFFTEAYLLAAAVGLLLRPIPEKYLTRLITVLYYSIVLVVGMAIFTYGMDLRLAALLAMVEFFVIQPVTTIVVFNGTPKDLLRIAYSQQNGLTTLLMGIAFQALGFDVLHILLPAIIIVNLLNLAVNKIYSIKEARGLILDTRVVEP